MRLKRAPRLPHPGWLPTPEEIRAECARIRAEKNELPDDQHVQRLDLRTLIDVDDDDSDDDEDG